MSLSGLTKSSATTLTTSSKNSTTLYGMTKAGQGWDYDDPFLTYDATVDADGRQVFYDAIGQVTILTPLTKNNA